MSNRVALLNTEILTNDPQELERARLTRGASYVEIGQAANRIPVPWLACFRASDLRPVSLKRATGPSEYEMLSLSLPCTSVAAARENLLASLPLFVAIVGDARTAEAYWKYAVAGLVDLSLPYLTMDLVEVLELDDPSGGASALMNCLNGTPQAVALIKGLAVIEDGFAPYTFDEFFNGPPEALDHDARICNSAALDPGYLGPEHRPWHRPESTARPASAQTLAKPWWKRW